MLNNSNNVDQQNALHPQQVNPEQQKDEQNKLSKEQIGFSILIEKLKTAIGMTFLIGFVLGTFTWNTIMQIKMDNNNDEAIARIKTLEEGIKNLEVEFQNKLNQLNDQQLMAMNNTITQLQNQQISSENEWVSFQNNYTSFQNNLQTTIHLLQYKPQITYHGTFYQNNVYYQAEKPSSPDNKFETLVNFDNPPNIRILKKSIIQFNLYGSLLFLNMRGFLSFIINSQPQSIDLQNYYKNGTNTLYIRSYYDDRYFYYPLSFTTQIEVVEGFYFIQIGTQLQKLKSPSYFEITSCVLQITSQEIQ